MPNCISCSHWSGFGDEKKGWMPYPHSSCPKQASIENPHTNGCSMHTRIPATMNHKCHDCALWHQKNKEWGTCFLPDEIDFTPGNYPSPVELVVRGCSNSKVSIQSLHSHGCDAWRARK